VITKGVSIPNPVIEQVGYVLQRSVVNCRPVEKQVVLENFKNEYRALKKGIFFDQIIIVPDQSAIDRRQITHQCRKQEQRKSSRPATKGRRDPFRARGWHLVQGVRDPSGQNLNIQPPATRARRDGWMFY
jgi:hypothetical protein